MFMIVILMWHLVLILIALSEYTLYEITTFKRCISAITNIMHLFEHDYEYKTYNSILQI